MSDELVQIADDFWNIRGTFKLLAINLGTQASLIRRSSGGFIMLDAYTVEGDLKDRVFELTDGGAAIEAILMLHPFHTVHVKRVAKMFPDARLYGTARHLDRAPELNWQPELTESAEIGEIFADDLDLLVPPGVDFIPEDENLHFASVLAHHRASRTLHVDDTLSYTELPLIGGLRFHPSLKHVLKEEAGAAAAFRQWVTELAQRCEEVDQICTAHGPTLPPSRANGFDAGSRVREAYEKIESTLDKHQAKYG